MKPNLKFLKEKGDLGVGTLIIFLKMLLVASVAATVLSNNTGRPTR